ncbi:MAG: hypothetical protein FWF03_01985 [Defluviitaleaceae bacterium]|nr:hypothetical protein [Defluviitaleaceae bacterium]
MITLSQIIDYLSGRALDPLPVFLMQKEIYKAKAEGAAYSDAYEKMRQTKHYVELAGEQLVDGSWGRLHSQDSKAPRKKFVTTEAALRRAGELGLPKDDPIISKCIGLMERYMNGEAAWTDTVEKHRDGGRGHIYCRPFMTAALINMFDPDNETKKPFQESAANTLEAAFVGGRFDAGFFEREVREYRAPSIISPCNMYGLMLLQNSPYLSDSLQRRWLGHLWNANGGVYYVSGVPPADLQKFEGKKFNQWLYLSELLCGFSAFGEFAGERVIPHLLSETERLLNGGVYISHIKEGRYSDSWRDKEKRKADMALRIARLLVKCG